MEHFYQNIQGWFTFPKFYSEIVKQAKDGFHFVEVGSWKGKSTAYLAVEIINSNKQIKFDCVDTWEGDNDINSSYNEPLLNIPDGLYNHFLENINPVKEFLNPIRLSSLAASALYSDKTLNCVFIDGAHDYKNVSDDIKHWISKIKPGGIISGHDYAHQPVKDALRDTIGEDKVKYFGEDVWFYKLPTYNI
jgi:hypothetical protein